MARALAIAPHGVEGPIKRMKSRVRQPRLVEMQVFDIAVEHVFDRLGVVQNTVIG